MHMTGEDHSMALLPSDHRHLASHRDFFCGLRAWRLWLGLGLHDVRIRYKRTILGPLWITVSMAASFICMGMLFSAVLKNDIRFYLPYLAVGMVTWSFVSGVACEAPQIFTHAHHIINSLRLPLVVHVFRCVVRHALVFLHNLAAAIAVHLVLGGHWTAANLLFLLALPILFATAFFIGLILAILGARFRDLGPIVAVITQLMFFMIPIIWQLEDIPDGTKWWVAINPGYHLLELVRAPVLGQDARGLSLAVSLGSILALGVIAYLLYCRFRHRISYWL